MGEIRQIIISKVIRGFCVLVGCQEIYYGDTTPERHRMAKDFKEYLLNPTEKEKQFAQQYGILLEGDGRGKPTERPIPEDLIRDEFGPWESAKEEAVK